MPDKPVPFDQPFTMVIRPRNPQNIVRIIAYPTILDANGKPTIRNGTNINISPIINSPPKVMGPLVVVNFPSIRPNYHFDFCLLRRLDTLVMDTFINYANFVAKTRIVRGGTTVAEQNQADQNYLTFISRIRNTPPNYNTTSSYIYDYLFQFTCLLDGNTNCSVRSLENIFPGNIQTLYRSIINLSVLPPAYNSGILNDDLKTTIGLVAASNSKFSDVSLNSFYKIVSSARIHDLLNGLITLNSNYQAQPANVEDIKQRMNNLKTCYKQISGIQDTIERLVNETAVPTLSSPNAGAYAALLRVKAYLRTMTNDVNTAKNTVVQDYTSIRNYFQNNPNFYYTEWYVNNTDSYADLQSKSGSLFSPQLGISFLGTPKNEGGNQVIPKLAIGVNINFRSINKSLLRSDIPNKTFAHYLSGFVGLTFGSFKNTQYSNLFASNSLLFGLNYRVTRSFYWSLGGTAFRQQDKNPIVNDFHTQLGIYTSLMLDIDIVSTASSITGILFK